jgi:hypothetical protein
MLDRKPTALHVGHGGRLDPPGSPDGLTSNNNDRIARHPRPGPPTRTPSNLVSTERKDRRVGPGHLNIVTALPRQRAWTRP